MCKYVGVRKHVYVNLISDLQQGFGYIIAQSYVDLNEA
jgi:hypothetical protein